MLRWRCGGRRLRRRWRSPCVLPRVDIRLFWLVSFYPGKVSGIWAEFTERPHVGAEPFGSHLAPNLTWVLGTPGSRGLSTCVFSAILQS